MENANATMDANAVTARLNEFQRSIREHHPTWQIVTDKVVVRCKGRDCVDALKRASAHGTLFELVKGTFPMDLYYVNNANLKNISCVVLQLPRHFGCGDANKMWDQLNNAGLLIHDIFPVVTIEAKAKGKTQDYYFLPDFLVVHFSKRQPIEPTEFGGCPVVYTDALMESYKLHCPASATKNVVELMHELRNFGAPDQKSVRLIRLEFDILC